MKKRIFVVSDIHGYFTPLKNALDEAGFEPENPGHLLVCCGDYFDRGTENLQVLKYMERLKNKVLLCGNHEDMLLEIFETGKMKPHNYLNGTIETMIEFFGKYALDGVTGEVDFSGKTRMVDRVTEFIEGLQNYFETEHYVFTHGWLPTVIRDQEPCIMPEWRNASEEKWTDARWTKWIDMYKKCGRLQNKTIVCGHVPSFYAGMFGTPQQSENPEIFYGEGMIVVDAGTSTSGKIHVLVLEDELITA